MKRFERFLLPALCLVVFPASAERPNILFLFSDDQRPDTIAAHGNPHIRTPNLDRMVEEGTSFQAAYCMGAMGGAVCVPSRAMLMSGRSLLRAPNNLKGVETLPAVLGEAGYATFGTGKWHNHGESFRRSFQFGRNVFVGGMCDHFKVPLRDLNADGSFTEQRMGDQYSTTLFTDATIAFLQEHARERRDQPFFAYVSYTVPHDPRQPPPGYEEAYDWTDLPLPPNFMPQHPFDNGWMVGRDEVLAAWPRTPSVIRRQLAEYYSMITHMDADIGRILDALRELGLDENTVVIFSSDHGLAMGSHGLLGKQNLYEHSMRVPLILTGPEIPGNQSSDALIYLFDLFPTFCELAQARIPEGVEGRSLVPLWQGKKQSLRESIFTAFEASQRAVRDNRWKLIRYPHVNKSQLFDLKHDPHELINLADDPTYAERVQTMMALLEKWQEKAGDSATLTSAEPRPAAIDLSGRPRKPDQHQPEWIVRKYFEVQ